MRARGPVPRISDPPDEQRGTSSAWKIQIAVGDGPILTTCKTPSGMRIGA
jgi:hypothetical protein